MDYWPQTLIKTQFLSNYHYAFADPDPYASLILTWRKKSFFLLLLLHIYIQIYSLIPSHVNTFLFALFSIGFYHWTPFFIDIALSLSRVKCFTSEGFRLLMEYVQFIDLLPLSSEYKTTPQLPPIKYRTTTVRSIKGVYHKYYMKTLWHKNSFPGSKVHKANMGPTWGRQDPGGPHVGHMNLATWVRFLHHWSFVSGIHQTRGISLKGPVVRNFDGDFLVGINMLSNKMPVNWYAMPLLWCHCNTSA